MTYLRAEETLLTYVVDTSSPRQFLCYLSFVYSSFFSVLVVVEGRKRTFPLPGPYAASSFAAADADNDLSRTSPASGTTVPH